MHAHDLPPHPFSLSSPIRARAPHASSSASCRRLYRAPKDNFNQQPSIRLSEPFRLQPGLNLHNSQTCHPAEPPCRILKRSSTSSKNQYHPRAAYLVRCRSLLLRLVQRPRENGSFSHRSCASISSSLSARSLSFSEILTGCFFHPSASCGLDRLVLPPVKHH